jgi:hypothetical protein
MKSRASSLCSVSSSGLVGAGSSSSVNVERSVLKLHSQKVFVFFSFVCFVCFVLILFVLMHYAISFLLFFVLFVLF